eukprot:TRINITY_DN13052_c0_g1_i2.p1 TRINITY_DN13052_c0_g1~~TRINITY_DN13052_c0_g1_i2.p1  ORF type:complete len:1392 (-),score=305.78 TRINITY_DN13052_c0_g1_i2:39-4214(-)
MIRRPPRSTLSSSSAASDVYKRQVVGAWRRWKEVTVAIMEEESILIRSIQLWQTLFCSSAFVQWREYHLECVTERELGQRVITNLFHGWVQRAFTTWSAYSTETARTLAAVKSVAAKWSKMYVMRAFASWKELSEYENEQYVKLRRVAKMMLTRGMAGCLRQWRDAVAEHLQAVMRVSRLRRWFELRALRAWREVVAEMVQIGQLMRRVALSWQQGAVVGAWRRWKEVTVAIMEEESILIRSIQLWQTLFCSSAFVQWREYHLECVTERELGQRVITNLFHGWVQRAFTTWSAYSTETARTLAAVKSVAAKWSKMYVMRAFASWKELSEYENEQYVKLRRVAKMMLTRGMAGCLRQWRDAVAEHLQAVMRVSRLRRWFELRALRAWREVVAEMVQIGQLMRRVALSWQQGAVVGAWRRWKEVTVAIMEEESILIRSIQRWRVMFCTSALVDWYSSVRLASMRRRCVARLARMQARRTLSLLRRFASGRIRVSQVVGRFMRVSEHKARRRTVGFWYSVFCVNARRDKATRAKAIHAMYMSSQRRCFVALCGYSYERQLVLRTVLCMRLFREARAFRTHRVWAQSRVRQIQVAHQAVLRWQTSHQARATRTWRVRCSELSKARRDAAVSTAFINRLVVGSCWSLWRSFWQKKVLDSLVVFSILHLWLSQGLRAWRRSWHYARHVVVQSEMIGFQRYALAKLSIGWVQWRHSFLQHVHCSFELRHTMVHMLRFKMHRLFGAWRSGAHAAMKLSGTSAAHELLRVHQLVTVCWHVWLGYRLQTAGMREQQLEAGRIWEGKHVLAALQQWHTGAAHEHDFQILKTTSIKKRLDRVQRDAICFWQLVSCWRLRLRQVRFHTLQRVRVQLRALRRLGSVSARARCSHRCVQRAVRRLCAVQCTVCIGAWRRVCWLNNRLAEQLEHKARTDAHGALMHWVLVHTWRRNKLREQRVCVEAATQTHLRQALSHWSALTHTRSMLHTRHLVGCYHYAMARMRSTVQLLQAHAAGCGALTVTLHYASMYRCAKVLSVWSELVCRRASERVVGAELWDSKRTMNPLSVSAHQTHASTANSHSPTSHTHSPSRLVPHSGGRRLVKEPGGLAGGSRWVRGGAHRTGQGVSSANTPQMGTQRAGERNIGAILDWAAARRERLLQRCWVSLRIVAARNIVGRKRVADLKQTRKCWAVSLLAQHCKVLFQLLPSARVLHRIQHHWRTFVVRQAEKQRRERTFGLAVSCCVKFQLKQWCQHFFSAWIAAIWRVRVEGFRQYGEMCGAKLAQCNTHLELTNSELQAALNATATQAQESNIVLDSVMDEYNAMTNRAQWIEQRLSGLSRTYVSAQQELAQKRQVVDLVRNQAVELALAFSTLRRETVNVNVHRSSVRYVLDQDQNKVDVEDM